jgi:MFS family permease
VIQIYKNIHSNDNRHDALEVNQNAYLLCFGGFLLLGARLGDVFGRRHLLRTGIMIFSLSSLMIGLSRTPVELITVCAIQGIGTAVIVPAVFSLISVYFAEGRKRTRALAWYSVVGGAGASVGLIIGGVFAGFLSWRAGFLMNAPIGFLLWLFAERIIPADDVRSGHGSFDITGALSSTIGMCLLVYAIVHSADKGETQ